MSSLIKRTVPETPAISEPITEQTPEVKEAATAEAERLRKRQGYASTIVTGQQGVTEAPTTKKETLG